jgi:hypothetical protein
MYLVLIHRFIFDRTVKSVWFRQVFESKLHSTVTFETKEKESIFKDK